MQKSRWKLFGLCMIDQFVIDYITTTVFTAQRNCKCIVQMCIKYINNAETNRGQPKDVMDPHSLLIQ